MVLTGSGAVVVVGSVVVVRSVVTVGASVVVTTRLAGRFAGSTGAPRDET